MSFESKLDNLIKSEKELTKNLYSELVVNLDDILPYLSDGEKKNRKFINYIPRLKEYIKKIEEIESKTANNGLLGMIQDSRYCEPFSQLKEEYSLCVKSLKRCGKCKCSKCNSECKFDSCKKCDEYSYISKCDKNNLSQFNCDGKTIELESDYSSGYKQYTVLAIIMDNKSGLQYTFIQNTNNSDEKFILRYFQEIKEDRYEEITSESELEKIYNYYAF